MDDATKQGGAPSLRASWTPQQVTWIAVLVVASAFLPARGPGAVPDRDAASDPRPPGSVLLYRDWIEVNDAAPEDLEMLPGIGPAKAKMLVEERSRRGGYCDEAEVQDVANVRRDRWEKARALLRVRPGPRCSSSSRG